jgi:hypothetical protein
VAVAVRCGSVSEFQSGIGTRDEILELEAAKLQQP